MKNHRIKPPAYLFIAIILTIALNFLLPAGMLIPVPWTLIGIIPVAVGLVINVNADRTLHKAHTEVCPYATPSALVADGPYRLTRNPMYLGFVLILIGVAVLLGSLAPIVIVIAFAFLMDRQFIRMEEQKLAETFGVEWQAYAARTRRWI